MSLLTDFGLSDPFVGIMKAVLLRAAPDLHVVDLCHGVPPGCIEVAAFYLERSFTWFPEGSVHCCVVDPGVGSARRALAARAHGHYFIAPDNGLLGPALSNACAEVRCIDTERLGMRLPSRTFHGRDLFAPVAARLAAGQLEFEALGEPATTLQQPGPQVSSPMREGAVARGRVVAVDHFGNLITNLPGAWFLRRISAVTAGSEAGSNTLDLDAGMGVEIGGKVLRVVSTYCEAQPGEVVALVSSFETLEIAERDGSAEKALAVGRGAPVLVRGLVGGAA